MMDVKEIIEALRFKYDFENEITNVAAWLPIYAYKEDK
jgi:hypothetical protein